MTGQPLDSLPAQWAVHGAPGYVISEMNFGKVTINRDIHNNKVFECMFLG